MWPKLSTNKQKPKWSFKNSNKFKIKKEWKLKRTEPKCLTWWLVKCYITLSEKVINNAIHCFKKSRSQLLEITFHIP